MRLHLPGLFERRFLAEGGAAQSLRARRQGDGPHAQDALPGARQPIARFGADAGRDPAGGCRCFGCAGRRCPAARATIPLKRSSCRARGSTSRARPRRPGTSSSISPGPGIEYTVGDSFGLFPANDPALVDAVLAALGAPADFPIGGRALRDVLIDGVSLGTAPDMLFQLFSYITGGERRQKAQGAGRGRRSGRRCRHVSTCWPQSRNFAGVRPDPEAFIEALDPLQPRLYSIASSPKTDPNRVALMRRCGALSDQRPHAPRRRLDLPRRPHRPRRKTQGLCPEGARTLGCRPIRRCRSS